MTKKETLLRNYAKAIALYESPKYAGDKHELSDAIHKADRELKKNHAHIERASYYGFDGIALYENGKGSLYAVIPQKVNTAKVPRVVVYELAEVIAADIVSGDLCNVETYEQAIALEEIAKKRIKSASLLNSILEGIDRIAYELRDVHEEPKPMAPHEWEGVEVYQKNERSCIWVMGNTKPHTEELKAMGYKFSSKGSKWTKHRPGWWKAA